MKSARLPGQIHCSENPVKQDALERIVINHSVTYCTVCLLFRHFKDTEIVNVFASLRDYGLSAEAVIAAAKAAREVIE